MPDQRFFRIISPHSFLDKYIEREFMKAGYTLMPDVSSTDQCIAVFIAGDHTTPLLPCAAGEKLMVIVQPDTEIPQWLDTVPHHTIIRTPYVIGTGMTGLMRDIVAMVGRGTMFHLAGNEARVSVIHAIDVARLTVALCDCSGDFSITDGCDPTWRELIEALSVRVGHKRIATVSPRVAHWLCRIGRIWGGPDEKMMQKMSATETIVATQLPVEFMPVNVTNHLKTHIYTDEDL